MASLFCQDILIFTSVSVIAKRLSGASSAIVLAVWISSAFELQKKTLFAIQ